MIDTLPLPRVGDTIKAEHIAALSTAIKKRSPLNSPTVKIRETSEGFYMEARGSGGGSGGSVSRYLLPRRVSAGRYTVSPGLLNLMPVRYDTTSGDELDGTQLHSLTNGVIYLVVRYTTTFVDDYLTYHVLHSVYTHDDTNIPADEPILDGSEITGWRFHAPLATIVDDEITMNYGGSNLWSVLRDDSTLTEPGAALAIGRSYP
jgi:hypothetical protein